MIDDEKIQYPADENATSADCTSADALDETTEMAEALENGSDTTYGSTGNGAPQDVVGNNVVNLSQIKDKLASKIPGGSKSKSKTNKVRDVGGFNLSDLGNAQRLVKMHGEDLRFVHLWGKWLVWDGKRWKIDETGEIFRRAKVTVREIVKQAEAVSKEEAKQAIWDWALRSENIGRIKAMVELTESEPSIPVLNDNLDRDPWLLNVENGVLDLKTGTLAPHDKAHLITKLAPVTYDPNATCPQWEAFLEQMLPDPDVRVFLQRGIGYSLTGDISEQIVMIFHGSGNNGKSTLLETVAHVLGEYAKQAPSSTFVAKQHEGVPNDLASLAGSRLVSVDETEEGARLNEALLKKLSGGDRLVARFLHQEFFEFDGTFKAIISTNHRPRIKGTDNGIWRRLRLVPFTVSIPKTQRDKDLPKKLATELPGILAWAVRGCLDWQAHGLTEPQAVMLATAEYRAEEDVIGEYISDRCMESPTATVSAQSIYTDYLKWCEEMGEKYPVARKSLGLKLKERGYEPYKTNGGTVRMWRGISLREDHY